MSKRKIFNGIVTVGFILFASISVFTDMSNLISFIGLAGLLIILILGNIYYRHFNEKNNNARKYMQIRKISIWFFYIFLLCLLIVIVVMLTFGNSISLATQKLLASLLCVFIFCMLVAGYLYEYHRFQNSKVFSEARRLGIAINPKHPVGRAIYVAAFIVIAVIFSLIVFLGPTH